MGKCTPSILKFLSKAEAEFGRWSHLTLTLVLLDLCSSNGKSPSSCNTVMAQPSGSSIASYLEVKFSSFMTNGVPE